MVQINFEPNSIQTGGTGIGCVNEYNISWTNLDVNASLKMSVFAERECHFSPDSIQVYTALTTTPHYLSV